MKSTIYTSARDGSDSRTEQERNRDWWSRLPMTYEDWEGQDRSTTRDCVVKKFLQSNPWLTRDYFSSFKGQRVLEIWCGAGPATYLFAEGGAHVTAIDLTAAAVNMTTVNTRDMGVLVRQMDAECLEFPDAAFDHIFSWGVLHHSPHPEKAFAELARVLRPSGTALVMVYNRASARYWIKGAIWLLLHGRIFYGDTFNSVQRFFTDGYYHRHFTPAELMRCLRPLHTDRLSITHMANRMFPLVPRWFDEWCKRRWGFLLVAEVHREVSGTK